MNVAEVKSLEPLADVVELKPESKYLLMIAAGRDSTQAKAETIANYLRAKGFENLVVIVTREKDDVRIVSLD